MEKLLELWKKEPARIVGFVVALLAVLTAFGVQLTMEQQAAIVGIVVALLALLGTEVIRAQVYSPATHEDAVAKAFDDGHAAGTESARLRYYATPDVGPSDNLTSVSGSGDWSATT